MPDPGGGADVLVAGKFQVDAQVGSEASAGIHAVAIEEGSGEQVAGEQSGYLYSGDGGISLSTTVINGVRVSDGFPTSQLRVSVIEEEDYGDVMEKEQADAYGIKEVASGSEYRLSWVWTDGWRSRLRKAGDVVEKARWEFRVEDATRLRPKLQSHLGRVGMIGARAKLVHGSSTHVHAAQAVKKGRWDLPTTHKPPPSKPPAATSISKWKAPAMASATGTNSRVSGPPSQEPQLLHPKPELDKPLPPLPPPEYDPTAYMSSSTERHRRSPFTQASPTPILSLFPPLSAARSRDRSISFNAPQPLSSRAEFRDLPSLKPRAASSPNPRTNFSRPLQPVAGASSFHLRSILKPPREPTVSTASSFMRTVWPGSSSSQRRKKGRKSVTFGDVSVVEWDR
ncbi:hypothetical protein MKZ38_009362 [Zalerion maritima]|uniref:Uncharacterized protein n=1 Tax=Zalerion maritima TaxID=339359 RepID=A0AAD5WV53_9PEZI|nr:hypothetical protein MKZ38_009362 [Zalerion maritima]